MSGALPQDLGDWLAASAEGLDLGEIPAEPVLPRLATGGLLALGVPEELGGAGGDAVDAVRGVTAVARESLTAAFILWGHRCYTEFMVRTPNRALRERMLPELLSGRVAGASGLSNVMKFLAGLEPLQITARPEGDGLVVDGKLPWVTNLRPQAFHVATAADRADGGPTIIISLAGDDAGITRSPDLSLMGMRSSDTAAIDIAGVRIGRDRIISENAEGWLPTVRPTFIALQCGMAFGLARRALAEAEGYGGSGRAVLGATLAELGARLDRLEAELFAGLRSGSFAANAAPLFKLRIELADVVLAAVTLELEAGGGRCYLREPGRGFARRWREAAFIPVITPSLVQLRAALVGARQAA